MNDDPRLPSLNAMESFAAAARHLSFTAAARELYVTHGAISRMVRGLEADLGVALFRRAGRSVELTAAGAAYYPQVAEALDRITTATRLVRGMNGGNVLSIAALPTLAMRCLAPRLVHFQQRHPEILVDLVARDGPIDFSTERADAVICYGSGQWNGVEATLLLREEIGVYCSPALLQERVAPLREPADLVRRRLLTHSTRPNAWSEYLAAFSIPTREFKRTAGFEHFFMTIEAAVAGMGIALLPSFLVRDELASGRLVQPFAHTIRPSNAYYLLNAAEGCSVRKIRLFKAWLIEEARRWASSEQ